MRRVRKWNGAVAAAGVFVPAAGIFVCATAGVVAAMFVVGAAWGTTRPMISFCLTTASTTSCRAKCARNSLYGIVRTVSWLTVACQAHNITSMMMNGQNLTASLAFCRLSRGQFWVQVFHIVLHVCLAMRRRSTNSRAAATPKTKPPMCAR